MNVRKSVVRLLIVALAMLLMIDAKAQYSYRFQDDLGVYEVIFTPVDKSTSFASPIGKPLHPKSHEVRLSLTCGGTDAMGVSVYGNYINLVGQFPDWPVNVEYGGQHWYGATFDYAYWATEWFSIGATATWNVGYRNIYGGPNYKLLKTLRRDYISAMPIVRFAWYRRGVVQLYSSIGLGVGVERWIRYADGREDESYMAYCAYDIKPIGLAIGCKWFGFIELGYGSRGVLNVGFGHRFNSKNR